MGGSGGGPRNFGNPLQLWETYTSFYIWPPKMFFLQCPYKEIFSGSITGLGQLSTNILRNVFFFFRIEAPKLHAR